MSQERNQAIKVLVRSYYDYQRERMRLDGQLGLKKNGDIKKGIPDRDDTFLAVLHDRRADVIAIERRIEKDIQAEVKQVPLWKHFLSHVKGCGEVMTAVILSEIDIHIAVNAAKLTAFAGLSSGLKPGKKKKGNQIITTKTLIRGDKKTSGFLRPYNQFLKDKLCGVLGPAFLKCKSQPYSAYYYEYKFRLENSSRLVKENYKGGVVKDVKWSDATPRHRHDAAIRKMVKEFLKDLYAAWREIEGLSVREPYAAEYLGRKHAA